MIAGLENITAGEISIGDRVVNNAPPKERDIAMVFQNYALYPHMTVAANMGFSLKLRKAPKAEIEAGIKRAAEILGLMPLLDRYPRQLSGGQRQRVAMGRAIVRDPQVFLFDEPLSNLDAKLRVQMRTEIKELHQRLKTTTIYVTHDQIEAMTMADKIVVMHDGLRRADRRTARALRSAGQSVRRRLHRLAGDEFPQGQDQRLNGSAEFEGPGGVKLPLAWQRPAGSDGRPAVYGIRPEHFAIADDGAEAEIRSSSRPAPKRRLSPNSAGRKSSRCSANGTNSSRATRSGSNPTSASSICSTRRRENVSLHKTEPMEELTMTDFTRRALRAGRHGRSPRLARCRPGPARMGQGLGAGRAVEARKGRQTLDAALEVLRAGGRRRFRGAH